MAKNNVWISDAQGEEGSFCDKETGNHYDNVDGFTAAQQAQTAEERGDEVVWMDKSVFGFGDPTRPDDAIKPDDRYNIHMTQEDSQGVNTSSRQSPGR